VTARILFLSACFLSACTTGTPVTPVVLPPPPTGATFTVTPPTRTPSPSTTASPTSIFSLRPQYSLDLLLDYEKHTAEVHERILYPNPTGGGLDSLRLAVEPGLWPGCFFLESLSVDGQALGDLVPKDGRLDLPLPAALPPDGSLLIEIHYQLKLSETRRGPDDRIRDQIFGYTDRQLNLVDWYPFVVPYEAGRGWLWNRPANYGEHLVYDPADFDVTVRFEGKIVPVLAAPGQETSASDRQRFVLKNARTFALSASPDYAVASTTVAGVNVRSVYLTEDVQGGQAVLEATVHALRLFGELFAPYPHPTLVAVQGDFVPSMEYDGLFFVGHPFYHYVNGTPRDYLIVITVHETAHQWWFALVGSDQANEPWLDEALATYSERIFYERVYPDDVDWWTNLRLTSHEPLAGWVDSTIYDTDRVYLDAVYLRGAEFLGALREQVGDPAFFAFLNDYARTYSHRRATGRDFFALLETHSGADISGLLRLYFRHLP
jgi:hypothetical protein